MVDVGVVAGFEVSDREDRVDFLGAEADRVGGFAGGRVSFGAVSFGVVGMCGIWRCRSGTMVEGGYRSGQLVGRMEGVDRAKL